MRYFKAREIATLPKIVFDLVASSLEELEQKGLDTDPLVVTEEQLVNDGDPNFISYEYGICHLDIVNGEFAERDSGEIATAQAAATAGINTHKTAQITAALSNTSFSYDGHEFPLTPGARAIYDAVIATEPVSFKLYTLTGDYTLLQANIGAFKAAMNSKIIDVGASSGPVAPE